jgi:hypothetical protein
VSRADELAREVARLMPASADVPSTGHAAVGDACCY